MLNIYRCLFDGLCCRIAVTTVSAAHQQRANTIAHHLDRLADVKCISITSRQVKLLQRKFVLQPLSRGTYCSVGSSPIFAAIHRVLPSPTSD